ncbi:MAG: hypothetical protein AB1425_05910 [Actinomycetota bacterium]
MRRLFVRGRRDVGVPPEPVPDPELSVAIRAYAEAHSVQFDRAMRLLARAERLESEGTPSESLRRRAERARAEVEAGLSALRDSLDAAQRHAFDRELARLFPAFARPGGHA